MPHFIVEYPHELAQHAAIPALLAQACATLAAQGGVFPLGGIRARAIPTRHHRVAGPGGAAFVHATLKIGYGRTQETKRKVFDELFGLLQDHFRAAAALPPLSVSMELYEFDEAGTYKLNNVHARFRR